MLSQESWDIMGEKLIGSILTTMFVAYASTLAHLWIQAPKRMGDMTDICRGYSPEMSLVLFDLRAPNQYPWMAYFTIWQCFLTLTLQFFIYLEVYKYLSDHNKSLRNLLPETTLKRRKQKNAIDVAGHIFQFFIQAKAGKD